MSESFQVQLQPHGGTFACSPDQTLLEAAIAAGYWLPHSCRGGTCGSCELPLQAGSVRHAKPQPDVSPLAPALCRTCQAYPLSDVALSAPTVPHAPGQRVITTGARVVALDRPSADVSVIHLQLPASSGFRFQAGQYLDLLLKDGSRRSYSMANRPNEEGVVEWHVRRMAGGRFSTHAYDKLKLKDLLRVQGPYGTFALQQDRQVPLILLASGTGYAPIASLLQTHADNLRQRGAVLYWGGRQWSDLYAVESVLDWESRFPGMRLIPVLSEPEKDWQGRRGLVHAAVLEDFPDLSGHEVYACGNPLMIDAARATFSAQAGLAEDRFYCDAFVVNPPTTIPATATNP